MSSRSASAEEVVRRLLRTRRTLLADVDLEGRRGERLLVRSDRTGTMQLYEVREGELAQLTALSEPVATANYIPRSSRAILAIDEAGNERHQLYLIELDEVGDSPLESFEGLEAVTREPSFGHHFAGVSPDGGQIAYLSNRANGVDFDLWLYDVGSGEHRLCYESGAFCQAGSGYSPDGRFVSVLRPGERPLDLDLVLVDVETGEVQVPLEHPDEAAVVGAPAWTDPACFYAPSNAGREFAAIVRYELETMAVASLADTGERFDASPVTSRDGSALVVVENRDGASALRQYDPLADAPRHEIPLPEPGIVEYVSFFSPPILSADGSRLYYSLTSPRLGGDVFVHDLAAGRRRRLTHSPADVPSEAMVDPQLGRVNSFDGEEIPYFVFRPQTQDTRPPVVVAVHGGPEAQARPGFDPVVQALAAVGYGVVVPNVRGSTGYGKRYASLDDTIKRLDSVRDLEAVHGALEREGFDPGRAALWGGSYGGYMVLAGLAFQPALWAAGVDIVGVSSLVTFLENTSDYRRAFREHEYGSLARDRDFLVRASPLTHVDSIRAPLLVIHGRNDPRVPVTEAEQLVESLARRDIRCELLVYEDEGHGLARLANQLQAYPRAIAFLDEVLGRQAECGPVRS